MHIAPGQVATDLMSEKSYAVRLSVNTSSPISGDWREEETDSDGGDQMVVRTQPELAQ